MLDTAQSDGFWFMNNRVNFPVSKSDNADGVSVIVMKAPYGEAPPLHVHHDEDEIFHIIDGELRFKVGEASIAAGKGDTVLAPRGVPHGFRVVSVGGAEILTITRGGFEDMVRSVTRPALSAGLPEQVMPTPDLQAELAAKCAANRIDLLGPPIA